MPSSLCVVLVGPEQAANVGFVARTMACYSLTDLRIVGSPGIAADGAARKTGKAVPDLLNGVRYYPSLEGAISDCASAYGFTRRSRDPAQSIEEVRGAALAWRSGASAPSAQSVSALVFGRESKGLFREETLLLSHLVRIPTPSETISLNLSHAVAIALHEFSGTGSRQGLFQAGPPAPSGASASDEAGESDPTRGEAAEVLAGLMEKLEAGGFFKGGKAEAQREYVRLLWQRLRPNRRETDFLAGMLRNLGRGPR
jgi:tRNA/rRNA methyltransferase